jgi:hypothetical protein
MLISNQPRHFESVDEGSKVSSSRSIAKVCVEMALRHGLLKTINIGFGQCRSLNFLTIKMSL